MLLVFLIFSCFPLSARFLDKKAEGWHWYESPAKKKPKKKKSPDATEPQEKTPTEMINSFKKEVEARLHLALVNPTFENVQGYMEVQKKMMDRSEKFANRWMEVLYRTPHLDPTVKHPTNQASRHLYLDEKRKTIAQKIQQLSQTHGLFFFFKADCPYCHQFAPIVKIFAKKYGWDVLAISMDGSTLPEFPNARMDNGAAQTLNVQNLPALLAVEPKTGQVLPLSWGARSQEEIERRIHQLVKSGDLK